MLPIDLSVLYVDDDDYSREVMQVMLAEVMGVRHITLLPDSHNFIAHLEAINPPPSLILLDIHMQPYDGLELLAMIRRHPRFAAVPIAALTASVMNEEVHRLWGAGFKAVIAKPIDMERFPGQIEKVLAGEIVHG